MCNRLQEYLISFVLAISALDGGSILGQGIPDPALIFEPPGENLLSSHEVLDIGLPFADGSSGHLSELWAERPLFVTLVCSRCAGICSPYMGLLKSTVQQVGGGGEQYQIIVISFDIRDRPEELRGLAEHHHLENEAGWAFAVPASQQELTALCESLDFDFRWDEQRQQYNHPAMTVALRGNKFARISVGEEISPGRFKEMLSDAISTRRTSCASGREPTPGRLRAAGDGGPPVRLQYFPAQPLVNSYQTP